MNSVSQKLHENQPPGFLPLEGIYPAARGVDVREVFLLLWRRKLAIIGCILLGMALAVLALLFIPPNFSARTLILMEAQTGRDVPQEFSLNAKAEKTDTTHVLTELEVM